MSLAQMEPVASSRSGSPGWGEGWLALAGGSGTANIPEEEQFTRSRELLEGQHQAGKQPRPGWRLDTEISLFVLVSLTGEFTMRHCSALWSHCPEDLPCGVLHCDGRPEAPKCWQDEAAIWADVWKLQGQMNVTGTRTVRSGMQGPIILVHPKLSQNLQDTADNTCGKRSEIAPSFHE